MVCVSIGVSAAAWAVAVVLAVLSTTGVAAYQSVAPWLLFSLSVGITSSLCVMIESASERVLRTIHAELDGEISERHLSAV